MTEPRTTHRLVLGDARDLSYIADGSIHLVVTSPPYWNLKEYPDSPLQMGNMPDYDEFLAELDKVWAHCARVLVPGGRVCCVVGDVCVSRRRGGRHFVMPLPSDILVHSRQFGFDNLTPIIWFKVANIQMEASKSSRFLGKPYLPNGVIKNDFETILMLRKPALGGRRGYRAPPPYPKEIPYRLIRMFSFAGDTVLDPFIGTGTTALAAIDAGRNSIGVETDPRYAELARRDIERASRDLWGRAGFQFENRQGKERDRRWARVRELSAARGVDGLRDQEIETRCATLSRRAASISPCSTSS